MNKSFVLAIAFALLTSACGDDTAVPTDDNDGTPPTMEPTNPPDENPPVEEPPFCGLESVESHSDIPLLGEDWTNGMPFETPDVVGYASVWSQPGWTGLDIETFSKSTNFHRTFSLSSVLLSEGFPNARFEVQDILIEGSLMQVLFTKTTYNWEGYETDRVLMLSTIDAKNGLTGLNYIWAALESGQHRLALDGGELILGTYIPFTGSLSFRTLTRLNGEIIVQNPAFARYADPVWTYGFFLAFDMKDGLATFRLASNDQFSAQLTRYRACH